MFVCVNLSIPVLRNSNITRTFRSWKVYFTDLCYVCKRVLDHLLCRRIPFSTIFTGCDGVVL